MRSKALGILSSLALALVLGYAFLELAADVRAGEAFPFDRTMFDTVVVLWAALVGLSRVYLGVHYPSDVLASLAVGGLCLLVARGAHRFIPTRQQA